MGKKMPRTYEEWKLVDPMVNPIDYWPDPDYVPEDFSIGDLRSENGMFTFWPNTTDTDGFFAAKLRRR